MSPVRRLDPVESFIVGTIGQPGEREFFLQAKFRGAIHSFAVDKLQVTALADRMALLIGELKSASYRFENVPVVQLEVPLIPEFQVGVIGIVWLAEKEEILLDIQELVEGENELIAEPDEDNFDNSEGQPQLFKLFLDPSVANNFVQLARKVVAAGRAPCPFCGLPINKGGHLCPRANGYRR